MMLHQMGGQSGEVGDQRALGPAAEDDVELLDGDRHADPGEHAVHVCRRQRRAGLSG
jgi:hypothetical protein